MKPLMEQQKKELDRRIALYHNNPLLGSSWKRVRKKILSKKIKIVKKHFVMLGISIVLPLINFAQVFSAESTQPITIQGRKVIDITLKVDAPFSTATLTIQENGSAYYQAKQNGQEGIQSSSTLTPTQMNKLAQLFEDDHFLDMKSRPKGVHDPEDGSTYTITVRVLPQGALPEVAFPGTYSVSCYQFSCEDKFLELKNKIIELWGKDIWEIGI